MRAIGPGPSAWIDERGHVHGGYARADVSMVALRGISALAIFLALIAFAAGIPRKQIDPVWTIVGALCGIVTAAILLLEWLRGMNTIPFG